MQVKGDEKKSLDRIWADFCPRLAGKFMSLLVSEGVVRCIVMHRMPSNRSAIVMANLIDPPSKWWDASIVALRLSSGTSALYRSRKRHNWTSYDIADLKKSLGEVKMHAPTQQADVPMHPSTHPPI